MYLEESGALDPRQNDFVSERSEPAEQRREKATRNNGFNYSRRRGARSLFSRSSRNARRTVKVLRRESLEMPIPRGLSTRPSLDSVRATISIVSLDDTASALAAFPRFPSQRCAMREPVS